MKKQTKDTTVSIRINKEVKDILAVKGITVQRIIDAYIDSILKFEIVEKELPKE